MGIYKQEEIGQIEEGLAALKHFMNEEITDVESLEIVIEILTERYGDRFTSYIEK